MFGESSAVPDLPPTEPTPGSEAPKIGSLDEFLVLDDIDCVNADDRVYEHYDRILVRKDIFRSEDGKQTDRTLYNHAVYCEQNGLFLPSFALSCNIVARLYALRPDANAAAVLQQYKDKGNGDGWHAQNTIIDYGTEGIIHYPNANDFDQAQPVNASGSRFALGFSKATLQDALLEDALRDAAAHRFVRQLTGLRDPSVLVEIGKHFGKPAKLWFPWNGQVGSRYTQKHAAWFGCSDSDLFLLDCDLSFSSSLAARGVRRGER